MSTKEVLIKAKELIAEPEHWTKGSYFRTVDGQPLSNAANAYSYCSEGACMFASKTDDEARNAVSALQCALGRRDRRIVSPLPYWNDLPSRTHAQVLALFDEAIAAQS